MPLISVVIPLYNKGPQIKRAIQSVLAQKFQDFEIIIVDDGSTDKSAEVVKGFTDPKIRLIQQENEGVSAARNRGIEKAKADLIAFLDADDEWTPSFLETVLRLKNKYPEAGAYAAGYKIYRGSEIKIANLKNLPPAPWEGLLPSYFMSTALGDHPVCSSAVCIPRNIIKELGGFKKGVVWGEDVDLWGRVALKYPIAYSWEIGAIYHKEAINRSFKRRVSHPIDVHPFVKSAQKLLASEEVPPQKLYDLRECIAKYQILTASQNLSGGYRKSAKENLKKCDTELFQKEKLFFYCLVMIPHPIYKKMMNIVLKRKKRDLIP